MKTDYGDKIHFTVVIPRSKSMLKKKVLCSALVLATAFSTAAGAINGLTVSGETTTTQTKKVEIVDEFLISSWVSYYGLGVKDYASQTKELAEAGLNFIWHPTKIGGRESVFTESASVRTPTPLL